MLTYSDRKQTIALMLIDMVQSRASDLRSEGNSLGGTLTIAIERYEGLSTASVAKARRGLTEEKEAMVPTAFVA